MFEIWGVGHKPFEEQTNSQVRNIEVYSIYVNSHFLILSYYVYIAI